MTISFNHPAYRIDSHGCFRAAPSTYRRLAIRLTPGGKQILSTLKEHTLWCRLPYGKWTCEDGREVLFNRHYEPIWEARPGEPALPADPKEWVPWIKQEWFWANNRYSPWKNRKTLDECMKILREFTSRDDIDLDLTTIMTWRN